MFEKLIDLLVAMWDNIAPAEVLDPYQGGVVLRLGNYQRTIGPGFHWKWPFIERILPAQTYVTTMRLPPQTLTTKDDVSVVVSAIVRYAVRDVKPFLLDIGDQNDVLADVTAGATKTAVNNTNYADLQSPSVEKAVLDTIRSKVNQYGFKVSEVTFTDMGRVRSIRLIQQSPLDIAN